MSSPSISNSSAASSANSTSTQWPSRPSSPQNNDMKELQNILDHALHDPFSTHPGIASLLKANFENHCKEAATKLVEADVLLAVTGAGFSADSGLATYDCVANIDAYRSKGWRYRDLCTPLVYTDFSSLDNDEEGCKLKSEECDPDEVDLNNTEDDTTQQNASLSNNSCDDDAADKCKNKLSGTEQINDENNSLQGSFNNSDFKSNNNSDSDSEVHFDRSVLPKPDNIHHPQWFYGFWGQCFNDYRRVGPHDGYDIVARWAHDKNHVHNKQTKDVDIESVVERGGEEAVVAKQIRSMIKELEKGDDDDDDNSCCSGENDEPYYVSDERAGAFYLFTSNVDAHSFDVFQSHEIRECHGNVELWQCHNFACGTNDSSMQNDDDDDDDKSCIVEDKSKQKGWGRRLWRIPDDHKFIVSQETMAAPYSLQHEVNIPSSVEPEAKRQKSESESDHVINDDDTANALGALMENTIQRHLESGVGGEEGVSTSADSTPAHIGDVHGKPRISPLKHMQWPDGKQNERNSHYLPITTNWPKCPRCGEAARPAVLMFEDLDWVYSKEQERRWQNWCQSLLKVCKHRARGDNCDQLSLGSASTTGSAMSESGWENVFDEDRADETENTEDKTSRVPRTTTPMAFSGDTSSSQSEQAEVVNESKIERSQEATSSSPLKVCIIEIGCGYNVPTCRAISERIVSSLSCLGGDATLVRINPAHPEADDPSVEDNVISIMEKGLASLRMIDDEYRKMLNNQDQ